MAKKRKKEEEQEKAYEVKDKRRVTPEGTIKEEVVEETKARQAPAEEVKAEAPPAETKAEAPPEETEVQAPEEQPPGPEAEPAEQEAELPLPDVYATLGFMVGMLAEQAWRFLGIRLTPGQKEMVKDLGQAKLAIDTLVFIFDKLHAHVSEDERTAMRELISNLQINFVQRNK